MQSSLSVLACLPVSAMPDLDVTEPRENFAISTCDVCHKRIWISGHGQSLMSAQSIPKACLMCAKDACIATAAQSKSLTVLFLNKHSVPN